MKRFFFVLFALLFAIAPNVAFSNTANAESAATLDASSFIGLSTTALTARLGSPARTEPSEYGFTWYVYNKDYNRFLMVGVQNGAVVALYTNSKYMAYGSSFRYQSTKATVRAALGKPITYVSYNGTVCILNNTDQKDVIRRGDNYVVAFYDIVAGTGVTSILIVPKALEDKNLVKHPALTGDLVAAYQRLSVDLTNSSRVRAGLKALVTDAMDTKLAVYRSTDMRDRNYFSHYTPAPNSQSPFQIANKMGIRYTSMGENIAYGNVNAIIAHEAYMNSAGHRSNILTSKYTKMGAGVAYGGSRYVLLTDIFQN